MNTDWLRRTLAYHADKWLARGVPDPGLTRTRREIVAELVRAALEKKRGRSD